ncbi:proline-rich protein HaeIII subfamily 1-like [Heteronotia binoei]|uniref:proline-rich protein HaeIII subfamily 1-like n=1 Tax=Heteronotia binoei TaxID=13085 RepID=UPI002931A151|nr:proline-rich protein HaeIII subfamily 1-like [Heteronotia binoei]
MTHSTPRRCETAAQRPGLQEGLEEGGAPGQEGREGQGVPHPGGLEARKSPGPRRPAAAAPRPCRSDGGSAAPVAGRQAGRAVKPSSGGGGGNSGLHPPGPRLAQTAPPPAGWQLDEQDAMPPPPAEGQVRPASPSRGDPPPALCSPPAPGLGSPATPEGERTPRTPDALCSTLPACPPAAGLGRRLLVLPEREGGAAPESRSAGPLRAGAGREL